jgi:hypothetical protein
MRNIELKRSIEIIELYELRLRERQICLGSSYPIEKGIKIK